ncbi:MAG TPA: hypothetical protein DDW98_07685 [Gammaproteobacteria bacterium]|nr:hypothetical protein [Gammaproteobacteria bacterium]
MAMTSDPITAQFARVYAEAVVAYLTRREDQQVFINYRLDDALFGWDVDDEGIAGDDVDHLIMDDWQRHTGLIPEPLDPAHAEFSPTRLKAAIEAAVLENGFAARIARSAREAALADAAEARESDPRLH